MTGSSLSLTEATSGQLLVTSTAYTANATDTLLSAKQNALTVSSVTGSSLLSGSGTILKRLNFDTGDFSVSDSGHALSVSLTTAGISLSDVEDMINGNTTANASNLVPLWSSYNSWLQKLQLVSPNGSSSLSDTGSLITLTLADYQTGSQVTTQLQSYASTAAMTSAIATATSSKQDSLQWLSATGVACVDPTTLNVLRLNVSTPLSINVQEAGRSIFIANDTYSKSEGDARYWQTSDDLLQVNHPSETRYWRASSNHGSNVQQRYRGGSMLIRRTNAQNTSATVLTFSSTNQNVTCAGNFSSNSDRVLKDNEVAITVAEAGAILDAVEAKKYTRNDTGERRHGFVPRSVLFPHRGEHARHRR